MGVQTFVGHAAVQVGNAQAVVVSTAIQANNPEVVEARCLGLPVVQRAQMLAELMRGKRGIAVAGTHGKTTTTSLVSSVLVQAGLDPSFVIGGELRSAGVNARSGSGECVVVEADESDASFLHLQPVMAVVTNIDADHMETYGHDFAKLQQTFVDFLQRLPFYGRAVLCTDDAAVREVSKHLHCAVTTYGLGEGAQLRAVDVKAVGTQMHFTVKRCISGQVKPDLQVRLNLTGQHNVLNALAAIGIAQALHIVDEAMLQAFADFQGVGRRFQSYGECALPQGGTVQIIDDYGHHPAEIAATLSAARGAYPGRRLVLAFQPHRYTRTRDCFADFVKVLGDADQLILTEVYAAGELPLPGVTGDALALAVQVAGNVVPVFVSEVQALAHCIVAQAQGGDVLLCMGAGSIGKVANEVVQLLQKTEQFTQEQWGV
jgi:UDP-N-acetylmuramate--alanine ligase